MLQPAVVKDTDGNVLGSFNNSRPSSEEGIIRLSYCENLCSIPIGTPMVMENGTAIYTVFNEDEFKELIPFYNYR